MCCFAIWYIRPVGPIVADPTDLLSTSLSPASKDIAPSHLGAVHRPLCGIKHGRNVRSRVDHFLSVNSISPRYALTLPPSQINHARSHSKNHSSKRYRSISTSLPSSHAAAAPTPTGDCTVKNTIRTCSLRADGTSSVNGRSRLSIASWRLRVPRA